MAGKTSTISNRNTSLQNHTPKKKKDEEKLERPWTAFRNDPTERDLHQLVSLIECGLVARTVKIQQGFETYKIKQLQESIEALQQNPNLERKIAKKEIEEKTKEIEQVKMLLERKIREAILVGCRCLSGDVVPLRGFRSKEEVENTLDQFCEVLSSSLPPGSLYVGIRGSAVTGESTTGRPYRPGTQKGEEVNDASDVDFFFVFQPWEMYLKARNKDSIPPKELKETLPQKFNAFVDNLQRVSKEVKSKIGRKADITLCTTNVVRDQRYVVVELSN